jgi:hypothetical protein
MTISSTLTQTLLINVCMLLLCLPVDYTGHRVLWKGVGEVKPGNEQTRINYCCSGFRWGIILNQAKGYLYQYTC